MGLPTLCPGVHCRAPSAGKGASRRRLREELIALTPHQCPARRAETCSDADASPSPRRKRPAARHVRPTSMVAPRRPLRAQRPTPRSWRHVLPPVRGRGGGGEQAATTEQKGGACCKRQWRATEQALPKRADPGNGGAAGAGPGPRSARLQLPELRRLRDDIASVPARTGKPSDAAKNLPGW